MLLAVSIYVWLFSPWAGDWVTNRTDKSLPKEGSITLQIFFSRLQSLLGWFCCSLSTVFFFFKYIRKEKLWLSLIIIFIFPALCIYSLVAYESERIMVSAANERDHPWSSISQASQKKNKSVSLFMVTVFYKVPENSEILDAPRGMEGEVPASLWSQ